MSSTFILCKAIPLEMSAKRSVDIDSFEDIDIEVKKFF